MEEISMIVFQTLKDICGSRLGKGVGGRECGDKESKQMHHHIILLGRRNRKV